ncbi:MAG: gamma carbonic anhydrase family protein [Spirochaetaceae bacterium]|nr:gamma carbonic anhydrase family protein [Spirochaetaceae bacterium]MDT8299080.1 gamma carbonic anhydrase family protein [Spirochaetaceae bacterium]
MIYEFEGHFPDILGERVFIAPGADVIGKVTLHEDVGIWFNTTVRGDLEIIVIGRGTNVQDGCSVHTDRGFPTTIGENVTIGHNCVIHGCTIGDGTLVGMGSVVLSGAKIGRNCLIGGGSLVTGSMEVPDGMLVLGSPARVVKPIHEGVRAKGLDNAANYVIQKDKYLSMGIGAVEKDRS